MKKIFLLIIICSLILTKIALSTLIEVDIGENIEGKTIYENQSVYLNTVNFSTEFYNTGSVPYNARARIFVYNDSGLIYSGWSQEKTLMPGDKKDFSIFWYARYPGNYQSKLRMYFGNEIMENEKNQFQIDKILIPEDVFDISNFRTYDNYVIFDIKSKEDAKNVTIIPYEYFTSWIFEQKTIDNMKKDVTKTVSIPYSPAIWGPATVRLAIVSDGGKYYSEKSVEMKKDTGITAVFYNILDGLKLIL